MMRYLFALLLSSLSAWAQYSPPLGGGGGPVSGSPITTHIIKPASDAAGAIQITSADGVTCRICVDTSTGNVGIGVASPGQKLDVSGSIQLSNPNFYDTSGVVNFLNGGSAIPIRSAGILIGGNYSSSPSAGQIITDSSTGGDIIIAPTATERMRVTTGGNVGIGTTGPVYGLDVATQGASGVAHFKSTVPTTGATRVVVDQGAADSSTTTLLTVNGGAAFGGGSTIIYRCTVAGALRVGQLTSVAADCGTAVDSGLRTN